MYIEVDINRVCFILIYEFLCKFWIITFFLILRKQRHFETVRRLRFSSHGANSQRSCPVRFESHQISFIAKTRRNPRAKPLFRLNNGGKLEGSEIPRQKSIILFPISFLLLLVVLSHSSSPRDLRCRALPLPAPDTSRRSRSLFRRRASSGNRFFFWYFD